MNAPNKFNWNIRYTKRKYQIVLHFHSNVVSYTHYPMSERSIKVCKVIWINSETLQSITNDNNEKWKRISSQQSNEFVNEIIITVIGLLHSHDRVRETRANWRLRNWSVLHKSNNNNNNNPKLISVNFRKVVFLFANYDPKFTNALPNK